MHQRANTPEASQSLEKRPIAVALQGGGSHGAFTWGVLDRLLEEPSLEIVGISGTSAGAMNAGVLADGLRRGGAAQARLALRHYWEDAADSYRATGASGACLRMAIGTSTTIPLTSGLGC